MMIATLKEFCDTTSVAPYSKISSSHSISGKVFWIVILLMSVTGLLTHLSFLTQHFLSQPTSVNVDMINSGIDFPDVIVCPTMHWSHTLIQRDPNRKFLNLLESIESVCIDKGKSFEYCHTFANDVMVESLRNNKLSFLRDYIYLRENFILSCEYNYAVCSWRDFQAVHTAQYGICYKFTPPNTSPQFEHFFGGLKLLTYIEDVRYPEILDKHILHTRGNLVFVVRNNTHIDYSREAPISVSAGQTNSIGVSFSKINHQNTNKHKCEMIMEINDHNVVKTIPYKHLSCLDAKINDEIFKSCRCLSSSIIHTSQYNSSYLCLNPQINQSDVIVNIKSILENYECERGHLKSMDNLSFFFEKYCKRSCHTYRPNFIVSSSSLSANTVMSREYEDLVVQRFKDMRNFSLGTLDVILNSTTHVLKSFDVIRNNLVMINIFIHSSEVLIYDEYVSYTLVNYLSEGAGVFGAWVGISVVTIFEFFELFGNLMFRRKNSLHSEDGINVPQNTNSS